MRYPKYLKNGGRIGLFAPSFGCNIDPYKTRLLSAITQFKSKGYNIIEAHDLYTYHFGASADKKERAKAFEDLYINPTVDFIWSVGGGEWMMDIIPLIDFEKLKSYPPKYIMGYSDNTNLTFLMNTLLDTASIYGQNFAEFGMKPWDKSLDEALEIISGQRFKQHKYDDHEHKNKVELDPLAPYTLTEHTPWKSLSKRHNIQIEGRLIGGCLDILMLYPGLKYDQVDNFNETYKHDGIIWFLEACDLNLFGIKRGLWQLKEAGWFKHLKGIIIGRPLNGDTLIDITHEAVLHDIFDELEVEVLYDLDFGHIAPTFTIISGAMATISYNRGQGSIEYKLK